MSSVDFKKCRGGTAEASAMIRHAQRHDGRDVEYANRWVDKTRTHLNSVVTTNDNIDAAQMTSDETYRYLKERVAEIDAVQPPKRIRKDRVTVVTMTIAAPDAIREEDEERFFQIIYDEIARYCGGAQNITAGYIHRDELHEYIDTDGSRKTSRPHMHVAAIPYVEGVGVNGKAFETRARMRALNNHIDQRCRDELGVAFLTGRRGRTGRSVEDLQAMSEGLAIEQAHAELDRLQAELSQIQQQLIEITDKLARLKHDGGLPQRVYKSLQGEYVRVPATDVPAINAALLAADEITTASQRAQSIIADAQRQADAIVQDAQRAADKIGVDAYKWRAELRAIQREHPELFNTSGAYVHDRTRPRTRTDDILR